MEKLIPLKEAADKVSMSYENLRILVAQNKYLGVFKIGGRYKVDFNIFRLNFNEQNTSIKVNFEKLRRYFETECPYWNTVSKSTATNTKIALREAGVFFNGKDFNKENIFLWKNELKKQGKADGTVRKYLCALSRMSEECILVGLLEDNPCKGTFVGLKKVKRTTFLTIEERERLINVCYEDLSDKINFAIETGLRQGEQFGLTWDRVFLKEKEIIITKTKTNKDRVVPLSPVALKILEKRKAQNLYKPFDKYIAKDYKDALKRAGITKGVTWHDLRRTFGMWLLKGWFYWAPRGCNKSIIGKFLGHMDEKTTSVYAEYDVNDLHGLIDQELYEEDEDNNE